VIQEAFMNRRPVICSDIGGMAEKVAHSVNGLHFTVGDPAHLAQTIITGVRTPGLWDRLRAGIPAAYAMQRHVDNLTELYDELIEQRASQAEARPQLEQTG
jgi:glycosyltransferase involved in cell wall biosynthesis